MSTTPKEFKDFKDYLVILHNSQKREKRRRVYKAASIDAAVSVANIKERLYQEEERLYYGGSMYNATMCYELDSEGNPIWN